jgi:hypothetical protein
MGYTVTESCRLFVRFSCALQRHCAAYFSKDQGIPFDEQQTLKKRLGIEETDFVLFLCGSFSERQRD